MMHESTLVLKRRTDARWAEGDGGVEIFTDGPERDRQEGNIKVTYGLDSR